MTILGAFGRDYGISRGAAVAVSAVALPAAPVIALTGGFASAKKKCARYKKRWKKARKAGKKKAAARYAKLYKKWCYKAGGKAKAKKYSAEDFLVEQDAASVPDSAVDMSEDMDIDEGSTGGLPAWALPVGIGIAALGLVLALSQRKG